MHSLGVFRIARAWTATLIKTKYNNEEIQTTPDVLAPTTSQHPTHLMQEG